MLIENVIHIRESLLIGSRKTAFKLLILNISNDIVILMLVHLTLLFSYSYARKFLVGNAAI